MLEFKDIKAGEKYTHSDYGTVTMLAVHPHDGSCFIIEDGYGRLHMTERHWLSPFVAREDDDDTDIDPQDTQAWTKLEQWLDTNKFGVADGIAFEVSSCDTHGKQGMLVPVYGNVIVPKSVYRN